MARTGREMNGRGKGNAVLRRAVKEFPRGTGRGTARKQNRKGNEWGMGALGEEEKKQKARRRNAQTHTLGMGTSRWPLPLQCRMWTTEIEKGPLANE
jgi:hypothetical protein